jgi:nitrate/nitrite-specific signal transduction histidine kinase
MIGLREKTPKEHNTSILKEIEAKEKELIRPMRELLSTSATVSAKDFAQEKVDSIETEIQSLRRKLI